MNLSNKDSVIDALLLNTVRLIASEPNIDLTNLTNDLPLISVIQIQAIQTTINILKDKQNLLILDIPQSEQENEQGERISDVPEIPFL